MPKLHPTDVRVYWLDLVALGGIGEMALVYGAWQRRHWTAAESR